jgi:hypothetical protein
VLAERRAAVERDVSEDDPDLLAEGPVALDLRREQGIPELHRVGGAEQPGAGQGEVRRDPLGRSLLGDGVRERPGPPRELAGLEGDAVQLLLLQAAELDVVGQENGGLAGDHDGGDAPLAGDADVVPAAAGDPGEVRVGRQDQRVQAVAAQVVPHAGQFEIDFLLPGHLSALPRPSGGLPPPCSRGGRGKSCRSAAPGTGNWKQWRAS